MLLLVAMAVPALATGEVIGFAVNSDDQSEADRLLRVNLETGDFRFLGELPVLLEDVEGLAFDAEGQLLGVDSATRTLVTVNAETGAAQAISSRAGNLGFPPSSAYDFGLSFTCGGQLLLVAEQTRSLYEVDRESGAARLIGESGGLGDSMTAIASYGEETYALAADSGGFYRVDVGAGRAELLGVIDDFEITDAGMAFDSAGTLWAVASDFSFDPSRIFTIDPQTAAISEIASTRAGIESLAIAPPGGCDLDGTPVQPQTVPVNAPLALLLLAGGILALARGQRQRLDGGARPRRS